MPDAGAHDSVAVPFSVVIAAYNAAATLGEQLDALARQVDAPPFEVLVCDNGSSDDTPAVVRSRYEALPGLRLIDASARRGASNARNAGAAAARGEFLLFCDADDVVADDWVASYATCATDHDALAGGWEFARLNDFHEHTGADHAPLFYLPFLPGFAANGAGNLAVRRSVFAAVGGFDTSLRAGEDADLCIRMQLAGTALEPCPHAVVHVRLKTGLQDTTRQAFGFGRADKQLRYKYAAIATSSSSSSSPRRSTLHGVTSLAHSLAALRRRAGRLTTAHAVGRWAGATFGRIPAEVSPLKVPS